MIGQTDVLDKDEAIGHWKARGLDFSRIFHKPDMGSDIAIYNSDRQDHPIHDILDRKLIAEAAPALEDKTPVKISMPIYNTDRTAGAMLSGEVAKRYGHDGLPEDTISVSLNGTAGQSFGAFLAHGVTLDLVGEANDYVGKGLSGGRIVVRPPEQSQIVPEESIIVGKHRALWRDHRGMLLPRRRRRTLRRTQFRRHRGGRGHRGSRLRIHDRRHRRGHRRNRPQLRRRHERRRRLCARRGGRFRTPLQPVHGRPGAGDGGR